MSVVHNGPIAIQLGSNHRGRPSYLKRSYLTRFGYLSSIVAAILYSFLFPLTGLAQSTDTSTAEVVAHSPAASDQFAIDNLPPQAAFTFRVIDGLSSRQIAFDAAASSDNVGISNYEWRFGDGTNLSGSRAVSVVHSYPRGKFDVSLTVADAAGLRSTHTLTVDSESNTGSSILAYTSQSPIKPKVLVLAPPVVIAPKPGAIVLNGSTVSFSWKSQPTADLYDFRILNAASEVTVRIGEFAANTICTPNRCKMTQDIDLKPANGYTWQAKAHNRADWSEWSDSAFNVLPPNLEKPGMPLSLYPGADTPVNNDETITFLWSHKASVESYRFQLLNRESGKILVDTKAHSRLFCNPTQCAYSRPVTLPVADTYAWQIQALNLAGVSGWFRTSFEVVRNDKQALPVAAFDYSLASTDPMSVTFNASGASGDSELVKYAWSFGDGTKEAVVASDHRISYQYTHGGSYFVELTITDASGGSDTTQQLINVGEGTVPEAHFLIDGFDTDAVGAAPFLATFDPTSSSDDGTIVNYSWDFGDASDIMENTDGAIVSHSYTGEGQYNVALTVTDDSDLKSIHSRLVTVSDSAQALSVTQAGRFISQATFGASDDEISRLRETGYDAWLSEQFRIKGEPHLQYVKQFSNAQGNAARHEIWWQDVIRGEDQLRQRIALALSQIFKVSDNTPGMSGLQNGVTAFYDLLRDSAFGNYRDLLEAVTLNPVMGLHTGMLRNAKEGAIDGSASSSRPGTLNTRVDQGFARTLLQRFTLGDYMLEADGTVTNVPAYSEKDIENIARALTGWTLRDTTDWAEAGRSDPANDSAWEYPMVPFESHHDVNTKTLPGGAIMPPQLSAEEDLKLVLDNLFAHSNLGPFVVKQLIQKLVTSNPSVDYVKRIGAVFNDNGVGVRGDLQAVIKAILLDAEARDLPSNSNYGKLREPLVRLTHLWRAFGVQPGTASERGEYNTAGIALKDLDQITGQSLLDSPSVSSLLSAINSPIGPVKQAGLQAPELGLYSAAHFLSTNAVVNRQIYRHYSGTPHSDDLQVSYLDFSKEYILADKPKVLLSRLSRLLMAGTMSDDLYQILHEHIVAVPDTAVGRIRRVHDAVSLILASPDYLVQM